MNRGQPWTDEHETLLRQLTADRLPRRVVARRLGRSIAAISARAIALGLYSDAELHPTN